MARHPKHEEHVNHERWAIPYGDLVTLLLAFFVVMYSISSVNEGKYRVLSDSLMSAFRQPTKSIEPIQIGMQSRTAPQSQINLVKRPSFIDLPTVVDVDDQKGADQQRESFPTLGSLVGSEKVAEIGRIADEISQSLRGLMDEGLVTVHFNELWLEVEIKDSVLFPSGSAQLQSTAVPVLKQVAGILRDAPNPVRVEGFTDNIPISTLLYPSNWELSTVRAASVVRLFAREGIDPARMSALGYGEFRPIADNATPAGRAQNRRVVLVVFADENLSFLLDGGLREQRASVPPPALQDDATGSREAGDDGEAGVPPAPGVSALPAEDPEARAERITAPVIVEPPSAAPHIGAAPAEGPLGTLITPIDLGGPPIRLPADPER